MNKLNNPATRNMKPASLLDCIKFVFTLGRKGAFFIYTEKEHEETIEPEAIAKHQCNDRPDGQYWACLKREDRKKLRIIIHRVCGQWVIPSNVPDGVYEISEISKRPINVK